MKTKPFVKWAGGKRWLTERAEFKLPQYSGRYIEPFVGGGAVFFHHQPKSAVLSDVNARLIETYCAIRDDWNKVWAELERHQRLHSRQYYYAERATKRRMTHTRAAQFLYLNRACWNGLYRENLKGVFNVPIGTKSKILLDDDDFAATSAALKGIEIICCDFQQTISQAQNDDLIFIDPPYTTAHNFNGFTKYNQNIFSWADQLRLEQSIRKAISRGVKVVLTNAAHDSIKALYSDLSGPIEITRHSVIAGASDKRARTSELLYVFQ